MPEKAKEVSKSGEGWGQLSDHWVVKCVPRSRYRRSRCRYRTWGFERAARRVRGTTLHRDREPPGSGSLRDGPHRIKAPLPDRLSPRFKIALLPQNSSLLPKAAVGICGGVDSHSSGASQEEDAASRAQSCMAMGVSWALLLGLLLGGGISRRRVYRSARCRFPMRADFVMMRVGDTYASYSTPLSG
jgi:hypothetical protein